LLKTDRSVCLEQSKEIGEVLMKHLNNLSIFFIIILLSGTNPVFPATKDVQFTMDFARFRYDSTSTYLEIYYTVFPCDIEFKETQGGLEAHCSLDFALLNAEKDSALAKDKIQVDFQKTDTLVHNETTGQLGILKLVVPRGNYELRMISPSDTVVEKVVVSPFVGERIAMSDLQFCSNIITRFEDTSDPFYKNTMKVIPNSSAVFGESNPLLYYYGEVYFSKLADYAVGDRVVVQTVVADVDGKVRMRKEFSRDQSLESTVEIGMFNISKLESGLYTLIMAATDSVHDVSVYRRRNFYVHNPSVVVVTLEDELKNQLEEEFSFYTEEELDKMFDQAKYIATSSEKNVYKVLNSLDSKKQFITQFWAERNKVQTDWKDEYYKRVEYANQNFSQLSMEGWSSDMGRVYIIYGSPDEYEHRPMNPNENAYEIWHYLELEGGVEFDFVDINGYGIYELVNSTKRGEVRFENWMSEYVYAR
jgi:GWxTD domain-containing protein